MNRINRMIRISTLCILFLTHAAYLTAETAADDSAGNRPNVLLIAVDDLNDWVGILGGHPQAKTPHIDRLARQGVTFTNAHCQSPVCNPSRASMLTSLYPETTGIYFLNPWPTASERLMQNPFLPDRFQDEGYAVSGAGKIFHGGQSRRLMPNYAEDLPGGFGPVPDEKLTAFPGHPYWDWGVYPEHEDEMPDYHVAAWASDRLAELPEDSPFLLAAGFFRPHVPQFAPQKWFDMYPLEDVQLPATESSDLADLSPYAIDLTRLEHVAPTHEWVLEHDEWKPLVQSYLACVTFVDAQIGKVLDALEASPHKDDTIVVLYSDHGFHLGEKERWAKRSIWEDSSRVPLIIAGPGIPEGQLCSKPVELLDIYPTLLELTALAPDPGHEGQSLVPLLENPDADWPHPARTSFGPGNVAIRSEHYRYIRYHDGSEEFYDHRNDPHEWHNLVGEPEYAARIERHRQHLPESYHRVLGDNSTGHKALAAAASRADNSGHEDSRE